MAFALLFVPGSFHQRPDPSVLASYVRSHTTDEQRVFVWGSYPEVLLAADRLPAGALVHSDFVTGRSGGVKTLRSRSSWPRPRVLQLMLADLRGHPPALVLDTSTAADLGYQHYPLALFPDVEAFVRGYELVTAIDGVTVWRQVTDI